MNGLYLRCNHYISKSMQKWDSTEGDSKENSLTRVDSACQAYLHSDCKDFEQARAILSNHVNRHENEPSWGFSNCNHGKEMCIRDRVWAAGGISGRSLPPAVGERRTHR